MSGNLPGGLLELVMDSVAVRRRASHDVALHVAAGSQGGEKAAVDLGNGVFQVALEHAMELDALPGREAQGAVAVLVRDGIDGEILSRGHASAGNLAADHEHEVLADALLLAVLAGVAVFL